MSLRLLNLRRNALKLLGKKVKVEVKETTNSQSKKVLCYLGERLVGEYDSITKCSNALVMSRPAVKKAIDNGTILDNGFKLVFK